MEKPKSCAKKVSVLVPSFNEEKSLPIFYDKIKDMARELSMYDWEFLFVDDGSVDNTYNILQSLINKDNCVSYISLSRNFGKENAMLAGFDYVRGDCTIIMDADLQDPPELIPQMLKFWEDGYLDVYARRRNRGKESWIRKHLSLLFYKILDSTTKFEILQNVGDFRLLDRQCIDALKQLRESERYTKGMFCWIGFKKKEILFDRADRVAGRSNWSFLSLFNLAIEGITSFTTAPLRFASILGLSISVISFLYAIYFITKTLIFGDPIQGFTTIIVVVLFLGGIQLLTIGILGEYIGKIFNETKHRPVYIVKDYKSGHSSEQQE